MSKALNSTRCGVNTFNSQVKESEDVIQRYSSSLSQCFVMVVAKNCDDLLLLGQLVATVAAHQPEEFPKPSPLKPCDKLDE